MRLLHTTEYRIEYVNREEIKEPYAILSHRWSKPEISYHEWIAAYSEPIDDANRAELLGRPGHTKVLKACEVAAKQGICWIWIDTCCIDKQSSAEVSEEINSMFDHYARAKVCYAFLADVRPCDSNNTNEGVNIENDELFTRGWTLQELLAPGNVRFYNSAWEYIGDKTDAEIARKIWKKTNIQRAYLLDRSKIHSASIAAKMSWACDRKTERTEDRAYSLMGLFGVNMPVLYGEGEKAFFRLQLEIIKQSDDESIFAWKSKDGKPCGMLASAPEAFADSGDILKLPLSVQHRLPWAWTNKGLELRLTMKRKAVGYETHLTHIGEDDKTVTLGCWKARDKEDIGMREPTEAESKNRIVSIQLKRIGPSWKRVRTNRLDLVKEFETHRPLPRTVLGSGSSKVLNAQRLYYVAQ